MACCGCLGCLLKLLNFLLTLVGLAMIGYGIYLLVEWKNDSSTVTLISVLSNQPMIKLGRPLLHMGPLSSSILTELSEAWFVYSFIVVGVILCVISCFGCIGAFTRHGCCLSCYSVLLILLIIVELGLAGFIFFDHSWKETIPTDKTGDFDMIYNFLKKHWNIAKWVALGAVILEALTFLLALVVRATNWPQGEYDSDDEYIAAPRTGIWQPLIGSNRQAGAQVTGVPVSGASDQRLSRNDAWSTRLREKYGLDTSEFTYNPTDSSRFQQQAAPVAEERSRCSIL
ncbi:tobamovirus multiplication protein 2A [Amborella trichopoda]|uniref:Tobamovirus multiplication protein 2A n=1 Tax=Amborella trichopoda TaxID=13333 RepID=W1PNG4_AMBTC|nr:tobamovirus multiplication protein 2A [Amborella trichopoda]ERN09251.1 hypothetical protein AMTR_s00149p00039360 [Amborella trichopoda]|eukprot:XP_006847670.1 tobamovirus multiplication protein 2A [Amborella trichopoda]